MSRFLTLSVGEAVGDQRIGNVARVLDADQDLVGLFLAADDALHFLSAVALQRSNPHARSERAKRRRLFTLQGTISGRWVVLDRFAMIADFSARADADLFVNFLRP